jgi:hypothetical protein
MGQGTRFDDSEKTRLVDNASIGINDNPVVGEESIDCVRVIVGDGLREFIFQLQQFFFHRIFEEQSIRLTNKLSDWRWQRTLAEADDVVKPVTHKTQTHSAVRCSAWLGRTIIWEPTGSLQEMV